MEGRIYFPGNPWPEGHPLKALDWAARIERDRGLFFDLHLESADYYAEREVPDDEEDDSWKSAVVWENYHSCFLSSTKWHHGGFLVADADNPLDFARLSKRTFEVDVPGTPEFHADDYDGRGFHIYLLGHDDVCDHRIRFTPTEDGLWDVGWEGKIALAYVGDYEFRHTFRAMASGVPFVGIQVPAKTDAEAVALVQRFCVKPDVVEVAQHHGLRVVVVAT